MDSDRGPSSVFICLCLQLSVCLLGSTVSASSSLWGKKVVFDDWPCLWQLEPEAAVPALEELSVCVFLRRKYHTVWTGFVYKAQGGRDIELGLGGNGRQLVAWLFGKEWRLDQDLPLHIWHSVCLTWSGQAQRLRIYINGSSHLQAPLNTTLTRRLAPNGTLTLGVSHNVDVNGKLQPEDGNSLVGEIGRFRMWAREWSTEEMERDKCADGDVVRWDLRHWSHNCLLQNDKMLHCEWSTYKIIMLTFITRHPTPIKTNISLENITINWLKSVFPQNISLHDISVSPSQHCSEGNNPASLHVGQTQGSRGSVNSSFDKCFTSEIYVIVNPEADVEVVQTKVSELLTSAFSYNFLTLMADNDSLSIQPVEALPTVIKPPPTTSIATTTSGAVPTQCLPAAPTTNMLTTRDSADINHTIGVGADTFFKVNLTLSIIGDPGNSKRFINTWLDETLQANKTMVILNLKVMKNGNRITEQNNGMMASGGRHKEYKCNFHVQAYGSQNVEIMKELIRNALAPMYEAGTIHLQTMLIMIEHIVPANCPEDTIRTIYGTYIWPETFPQTFYEMICAEPESERAYRLCKLDGDTDDTIWMDANMTACKPVISISDLDKFNVTAGNAADVVTMIRDLVDAEIGSSAGGVGDLSDAQLQTVMDKLNQVVKVTTVTPALGTDIVNIIGEILVSKSNIPPVANDILELTDSIGNKMEFSEKSASITVPSLALSMINVDPEQFNGLTFGVASFSTGSNPEIFVDEGFVNQPFLDTVATISLPSALQDFLPLGDKNRTRVQFHFYGTQDLFKDPEINQLADSNWTLNTYVVSASVNNSHVSNLKEQRVVVTLRHQTPTQPDDNVKCVYWDFQKSGGQGGWNSIGCETQRISANQTSCHCDHLTHFGVLLDRTPLGEADSRILTLISYLGCGISSIFLGITLLTYMAFEKLRRDYPSKILINLSVALLGLNMLFLMDSWMSSFSSYSLCIFTAASLHYFLLASFTWMGLEAVHMYFALVKVFNVYVPSYILKFCAVGWGIPLLIVCLVLAIDKDAYGNAVYGDSAMVPQASDSFCWLQSDVFFYMTVVAFVLLVLLCNISIFAVVLIQIRNMRTNKPAGNGHGSLHDLRAVASLTVLLGLTWPIAFFALGPARVPLVYLFSILNSLQGFFIFVFHCLMKENVRKQWRIHLCCGQFRLNDYSDWSRSVTLGCRSKPNRLVQSPSDRSVDTSSSRKISDSSN